MRRIYGTGNGICLSARRLMKEIIALDGRDDLSDEERMQQKRQLAGLMLDLPEISPLVKAALSELETRAGLSWEVREHIIERFEMALLRYPEAVTSRARLHGLMKRATQWSLADAGRAGRGAEGELLGDHPLNASRLDEAIELNGGEGSLRYDVVEGPAGVDVPDSLATQERLRKILKIALGEGDTVHRTVLLVMLGWPYREIADFEGVGENAISKRVERFRKLLRKRGV